MINRQLIVSGRVQGVGFRWSTLQLARDLNLTGWVQNELNGTVKISVQGPKENVQHFINIIRQGPTAYAHVSQVKVSQGKIESYQNFTIR